MQQRRLRLGDVLDDYCPRERRITNHVVLAMIDDTVKQTRCSTCDSDHEYKQAKTPARRRKTGIAAAQLVDGATKLPDAVETHDDEVESLEDDGAALEAADITDHSPAMDDGGEQAEQPELTAAAEAEGDVEGAESEDENVRDESDNWPVHRPLIRAQLPRPEGHVPERKAPDFTMRQGGKFDQNRNGQRHRGGPRQGRQAFGQSQPGQGSSRFGGQRGPGGPGGPGGGRPGQGQGNRSGQGGGRPGQGQGQGQGQGRGPRPPGGGGRKRGGR